MTYAEKLRDPRWQRRRLEKLDAADFHCESCGDGESTLHVHHRVYERGREPWDYGLNDLEVLCKCCHELKHEQLVILNRVLAGASYLDLESLSCIVAGYLLEDEPHEVCRRRILAALGEISSLGAETVRAGRIACRADKRLAAAWVKRQK